MFHEGVYFLSGRLFRHAVAFLCAPYKLIAPSGNDLDVAEESVRRSSLRSLSSVRTS
jgi:hypothetical protein